jgi:hypothetical protein
MDPIVINNFLPEAYAQNIYQMLTGENTELTWHFSKFSVDYDGSTSKLFPVEQETKDHVRFTHSFIRDNVLVDANFTKHLMVLVAQFENFTGQKITHTTRMKANLLLNLEGPSLQPPHVDGMIKDENGVYSCIGKKTLLYYVNNADGDTVFYNERFTGEPIAVLTEQMRITPKKGSAIIFDSNQVHSANIPKSKAYRCVINSIFETT